MVPIGSIYKPSWIRASWHEKALESVALRVFLASSSPGWFHNSKSQIPIAAGEFPFEKRVYMFWWQNVSSASARLHFFFGSRLLVRFFFFFPKWFPQPIKTSCAPPPPEALANDHTQKVEKESRLFWTLFPYSQKILLHHQHMRNAAAIRQIAP